MFEAAKSNKISTDIVEQIRKAIFEGNLNPGDKLPSEKELVETFQVSRATGSTS
jgi:GntR family transcriptional repressor for pyruvate dehydrogenase complex